MSDLQAKAIRIAVRGIRDGHGLLIRFSHDEGGAVEDDENILMIRPQDQIRLAFDTIEGNPNVRYIRENRAIQGQDLIRHPQIAVRVFVQHRSNIHVMAYTITINERALPQGFLRLVPLDDNGRPDRNEQHEMNLHFYEKVQIGNLSVPEDQSGLTPEVPLVVPGMGSVDPP